MFSLRKKIFIFFIFFFSLLVSFYLGENSSGGSKRDFLHTKIYTEIFEINFISGIDLFKNRGEIHSPFFYILIANLNKIFGDKFVNFLYLISSSLIPLILYSALKKKFLHANIDYLYLLSLLIFLSPYFRSSAVWQTTDNLALLFFLLSINFFLKHENLRNNFLLNSILCFSFLILASYIRYYYSIFFLLFFLIMYKKLSLKENSFIILFNLISSIPFLMYVGFIYQNRIDTESFYFFRFDFIFNYLIFTSLFFFYSIPFFLNRRSYQEFFNFVKQKKKILIFFILVFILLSQLYVIPDFSLGGGIFYKISRLYNLDLLFIFSLFGSLSLFFFYENSLRNNIIFLLLIFGFPIIILYQKYYDPLIYLVILTLLNSKFFDELICNQNINLFYLSSYQLIFLISCNIYYF